jgi:hypothetical protein
LRSRLGRTYGGEVRAWLAVGIWGKVARRDCEGILRSGKAMGGEETKEVHQDEMNNGIGCLRQNACATRVVERAQCGLTGATGLSRSRQQ